MLRVCGHYQIISPGEWKQCHEIIHNGLIVGFIEYEKTSAAEITRTRNIRGEVMDGECIDWLLLQAA